MRRATQVPGIIIHTTSGAIKLELSPASAHKYGLAVLWVPRSAVLHGDDYKTGEVNPFIDAVWLQNRLRSERMAAMTATVKKPVEKPASLQLDRT